MLPQLLSKPVSAPPMTSLNNTRDLTQDPADARRAVLVEGVFVMRLSRAFIALFLIIAGLVVPPASASAAHACGLPDGVLSAEAVAGKHAVDCGLVGRLVEAADGTALPIQPPGTSVTLDTVSFDGSHSYRSGTDEQGRISTSLKDETVRFPDLPGPTACERETYSLRDYRWHQPWLFRTRRGTTLGAGSQLAFDAATIRSVATMVLGRNTCGMRGPTGALGAFVGHTDRPGNFDYVDGQTTCGAPDRVNVIDSGDLPGGSFEATLAWTCTWSQTRNGVTRAVEGDIRLNDTDYIWTYNPDEPSCDPTPPADAQRWHYDIESVLVHEMGHVFGLVNLSELDDINLTMFPGIRRCSGHMRSLGRGDVLGLRALYQG